MPKGRKPNTPAEALDVSLNEEALTSASAALTEVGQRSAEVAERFGDGVAYDRERVVTETRFLMGQSAEAMLEAGKRLIQLKENELHGEFIEIVQTRLGLAPRTAQVMMAAAVKYLSPALQSKAQTFALLGKSKLFDLMVESEDELAELAEGGTVAGLSLDDMHSMSVRELREALADARQTAQAKDKVIAKRDAKIAQLEEASERSPTDEEVALGEVKDAVLAAQSALMKLAAVTKALDERDVTDELRGVVNNDVEYLAQTFAALLVSAGIPVQFDTIVSLSGALKPKANGAKGS